MNYVSGSLADYPFVMRPSYVDSWTWTPPSHTEMASVGNLSDLDDST